MVRRLRRSVPSPACGGRASSLAVAGCTRRDALRRACGEPLPAWQGSHRSPSFASSPASRESGAHAMPDLARRAIESVASAPVSGATRDDASPIASLRALFSDAGYAFVEPPIVYDASVFVELAGEDLRRRLFLTSAADGTEMALRPDYTIPVCLHHLASGAGAAAGRLRLSRPGLPPAPGRDRRVPAGRRRVARAHRPRRGRRRHAPARARGGARCSACGRPAVRIGDFGLFAAVLDALDLAEPWRRRLAARLRRSRRGSGR